MRKIPIYILSGFLGSGKTTLLKQFIQEDQRKNKNHYAVRKEAFENWLSTLPATIYRIKGYIQFYQDPNVYLFQYTYGVPKYIKQPTEFRQTLVFIGEQLRKDEIRKELAQMEYIGSKYERVQGRFNL